MKDVLRFLGCAILGFFIVAAVLWLVFGGPRSLARRRHFDRLVETVDQETLLSAAVSVIEGTTNQVTFSRIFDHYPSISNLPEVIHSMEPNTVSVDPASMTIEFHGGFDHYGFAVWKQEHWELAWYTEGGTHPMLTREINEKETANQALHGTAGGRSDASPSVP